MFFENFSKKITKKSSFFAHNFFTLSAGSLIDGAFNSDYSAGFRKYK